MEENIFISIVIPLYNKAHTIVKTLNTVFAQTYQYFEVIIVNDGSTDESIKVIHDNFNDSRIRIFHQTNLGVSAARNRGVDESRGKYIAFLDGDDEWHPNYLTTMSLLINQNPNAGLFLCGGLVKNADGSIFVRIAKGYENYMGIIQLFQNPEVFSHTSATIVHREKFNTTHRFIVGMCKYEDFLATQAFALTTDVIYCGLPLTKYIGGIDGQLTVKNRFNPQAEKSMLIYYNQIIKDCIDIEGGIYKTLKIYLKYNIRHEFKTNIIENKISNVYQMWDAFSCDVKRIFPFFEHYILKLSPQLYLIYIDITKVIWRFHKYPRVQQSADLNKIASDLLIW